jgi:hypothetical protein
MCDENLLAGMKMFRKTLTFHETSRKILDINVSAALQNQKLTQQHNWKKVPPAHEHAQQVYFSVCLSVCPFVRLSVRLEYENTWILNVVIKISVSICLSVCPSV